MCHQINRYAHANGGIVSPLNKNNSLITSAWKDSLIKALTLNVFSSRFELTTSIVIDVDVVAIRLTNQSTPLEEEWQP